MARKRMFDSEIINRDDFLELSLEAKAIYFLLGIFADDEGFISPKKILKLYGGNDSMLDELIESKFIIQFKSGVVLITDWNINNYLNQKRIRETIYTSEKQQIKYDENTHKYICLTNVKPEEKRIEESRLEDNSIEENSLNIICLDTQDYIPYEEIINYLNLKTGYNYRSDISKTRKLIQSRWKEGFKLDDFKNVIDKKTNEWFNTDMKKYLRPETLFGTKFEGYLNQDLVNNNITTKDIAKYIDWNSYINESS
jgi:uncharacterized phage protein (TIGR02220 family)